MSLTDNYIIKKWKDTEDWFALRGNETFFDSENYLLLFSSPMKAVEWVLENKNPVNVDITIEIRERK